MRPTGQVIKDIFFSTMMYARSYDTINLILQITEKCVLIEITHMEIQFQFLFMQIILFDITYVIILHII